MENVENVEIKKREIETIIHNLYDKYYNISRKILYDNNISRNTKFILGERLGQLYYKFYLLENLISDKKNLNDNNLKEILNYLIENFLNLENLENLEYKLIWINSNIDYFMDKLLFPKKDK